jgi:glycosyltransferase involved in cell wall biosynthesis
LPKNNGLSAVIITYNEERNIERCLASLVGVADEILVVDSFSTDKTEEICRRFNVRFICNAFGGHIEQKNFAASQAANDYVLSLDADEALTDDLRDSILKAKENWQFDAYSFNRLTNYCGKWIRHCGWYPDAKTRLWNRTKGQWGGVNPHDKWELFDRKAAVSHLKGDLLHYSYYTIADHVKQIEYFTEIAAKAEAQIGKRPSLLKIAIGPSIKFIKCFWLQLGFLDGYYGYVICRLSAQASFIKYVKTRRYAEDISNLNRQ